MDKLPEINIGLIGHVDHGKTTLVSAISGKWTAMHSEEIKRGITIRLGYADASIYRCAKCKKYSAAEKCGCGGKATLQRKISFVDAPGHETLMAIMISGASIMDAAVLMIAADEPCPQPQTREHLLALKALGMKDIIIIQNKIDLIPKEDAKKQYKIIKEYSKKVLGFEVPIIPVSAARRINTEFVIEAIQELFPTPKRSTKDNPILLAVRSFDVNKPGTDIPKLTGGVIGGSIIQGNFEKDKEIEILPGIKTTEKNQIVWKPFYTKIKTIISGNKPVYKKGAGGLVAFATELDPAIAKGDSLAGNVVAYKDQGWPVWDQLTLKVSLFDKVVGAREDTMVEPIKTSEPLMISSGTTTSLGIIHKPGKSTRENQPQRSDDKGGKGSYCELTLKKPICAETGSNVALSRNFSGRWRLIGFGEILK